MKVAPRAWMAVFLFLPLAGCVGDDAGSDGPLAPAEAAGSAADADLDLPVEPGNVTVNATTPWNATMEGCTLLVASVPLTPDEVRAVVPDGFEPTPFLGGVPGTGGAALVVTRCTRVVTPDGEFADHQESLVYVYADPPQQYRVEGIDNYRVLLRHGVNSADLVAAYAAHNHTAETATTTATSTRVGDTAETMDARAVFPGLTLSFGGATVGAGPFGQQARAAYRLFVAQDKQVVGALDLDLQASSVFSGLSAYRIEQGTLFGRPAGPALIIEYDVGDGPGYTLTPVALA